MSTPDLHAGHEAAERALAAARLPHMGVLRFAGPDAIGFLQGQVSNDTQRLAAGEPLLAAYSSAQGRVIAVLHLLPHSSGVIALLPRDVLGATCERLRKFVLRAKVKIEDVSDRLTVIGVRDAAALAAAGLEPPGARKYLERDGLGVARVGPAAPQSRRFWVIAAASLPLTPADPSIESAWRLADIREGLPTVYAATSEAFVAQMLNLDLIDGISFSKGCYTGQEIIARTQHLGRIKRRMFRLWLSPGDWAIGGSVRLADGRAGRLVELAPSQAPEEAGPGNARVRDAQSAEARCAEALAVLNLEPDARTEGGPTESPLEAASLLPLPYSPRLDAA